MSKTVTSVLAVLLLVAAGVAPAGAVAGVGPAASSGSAATQADSMRVDSVQANATQANCSFPVTATDATGTEVTVDQRPERVVTLSPSAAQTMWEIGGESQVVGVSQYASYLEGADSRTNVSGTGQTFVSVETVVSTEADLVLAPNVIPNATVQRLRDAGLTVFKFGYATSVEDIYAKTSLMGELTGNCEGATETVASMRDRIGTVREAVANSENPRVLVSQGGGWTAGSGTFIGSMVELAGGTNVAAEANISGYGQISGEVVVERNPQWIVQIAPYPKTEAYNGTAAVQQDQILTVASEHISQPAPRVVDAIVKMAKAFHPEAYAAANATTTTTTATETTTEATTATATTTDEAALQEETTETTTTESGGSVPGFGVPAALAALAGAAVLARRD